MKTKADFMEGLKYFLSNLIYTINICILNDHRLTFKFERLRAFPLSGQLVELLILQCLLFLNHKIFKRNFQVCKPCAVKHVLYTKEKPNLFREIFRLTNKKCSI